MKQRNPAVASQLVFVPLIGFRPEGTRVLGKRTEPTANGTRLIVLAAAAAPDRTDVVIEWELTGDPATCPPDSQLLVHSNMRPMERGLTAELVVGTSRMNAITMNRRAYHLSVPSIGAIDAIAFPPLPSTVGMAELHVSEGPREWRVRFDLVSSERNATSLAVEVVRDGVAVRASALAIHDDEVIVELEVEAARQIRQVGAPIPTPVRFSNTPDEDHRARLQEHRRVFGERARPITLEDDRGSRLDEVGRLFSPEPQQAGPRQPFINRFSVVFAAPGPEAKSATLVVPFVDLNDPGPSVTADLRDVPLGLKLGEHRLRAVSAEPHGADQRQVLIEVPPSTSSPRFMQPMRMYGADPENFGWNPGSGETIVMSTTVGDPPIVKFVGTVLRVDGPLRLEIPLA